MTRYNIPNLWISNRRGSSGGGGGGDTGGVTRYDTLYENNAPDTESGAADFEVNPDAFDATKYDVLMYEFRNTSGSVYGRRPVYAWGAPGTGVVASSIDLAGGGGDVLGRIVSMDAQSYQGGGHVSNGMAGPIGNMSDNSKIMVLQRIIGIKFK